MPKLERDLIEKRKLRYEAHCVKFEEENHEFEYPKILICNSCGYHFHEACLLKEIPSLRNRKNDQDFYCIQCQVAQLNPRSLNQQIQTVSAKLKIGFEKMKTLYLICREVFSDLNLRFINMDSDVGDKIIKSFIFEKNLEMFNDHHIKFFLNGFFKNNDVDVPNIPKIYRSIFRFNENESPQQLIQMTNFL